MAMTPDDVMKVVDLHGTTAARGITHLIRKQNKNGVGGSSLTSAQLALLQATDAAAAAAKSQTGQLAHYAHPGNAALAARLRVDPATRRSTTREALTPAEVAWLQRLPTDPTHVAFDDAVTLLTMQNQVTNASDVPLVRMIASPVREYHDRQYAEVELRNAQQPLPPVPNEALPALADALRRQPDFDRFSDGEVLNRAGEMLREHSAGRQAEHAQKAASAAQRIQAIDQAIADRLAVHR